jgi:magnesium transporter
MKAKKTGSKIYKGKGKQAGLAPGSLFYTGERKTENVKITLIEFNEKEFEEKEVKSIEECFEDKYANEIKWINIDGLHEIDTVEKIGSHYNIHPLVLEDILSVGQRPKLENYDDYLYIVFRMFALEGALHEINSEQISLILGKNFVITFQERSTGLFNSIIERLRNGQNKIRKLGPDYLTYTLIDMVVDNYFVVLEKLGEPIENLEDNLISNPKPENLQNIHHLKREMIMLRKSVWPMRELLSNLYRDESKLVKKSTEVFLRDVYDHTIQIIDTIETYRDMISGMLDTYLSSVSNKMNEVMKVLTIIATIFIPLTFIAGVYGMNFHHMPELSWKWFYPDFFWILILVIAVSMLIYFKRKKWI